MCHTILRITTRVKILQYNLGKIHENESRMTRIQNIQWWRRTRYSKTFARNNIFHIFRFFKLFSNQFARFCELVKAGQNLDEKVHRDSDFILRLPSVAENLQSGFFATNFQVVAEHKVEEDLYRLLQDVENDKYDVSHAKKQLVDDEKNTGLLKCKKVALVSSKSNRSSTSFTPKQIIKIKTYSKHWLYNLSWIG